MPITVHVKALVIGRSSPSDQPVGARVQEIVVKHRLDEIYTDYPFQGSRRITAQQLGEATVINRIPDARQMREIGIEKIKPGLDLSQRRKARRVYRYLVGEVRVVHPNLRPPTFLS